VQGQARSLRAGILPVDCPVAICIGATTGHRRTRLTWALVALIDNAVTVPILLARRGTARGLSRANLVRAGVIRIWDSITVAVRTARCGANSSLLRTCIVLIGNAITIAIRRAYGLQAHGSIRTGIVGVERSDIDGVSA
jgi:hypothetical protein